MPRSPKTERLTAPETREFAPNIGATTESSETHKERNEDALFVLRDKGIAGVFDGMGGGLGGEKASGLAAKIISKELAGVKESADQEEWKAAIKKALAEAQTEVTKLGNKLLFEQLDDPLIEAAYRDRPQKDIEKLMEEKDMSPTGTTASIVKMIERADGSADLVYGNVGDSRIYILKKDGTIEQVTEDQGLLNEAVKTGSLTKEEADFIDQAATREEIIKKFGQGRGDSIAHMFKDLRRSVASALGFSKSEPQIGTRHLEPGERVLVTSDGVHDNLTNEEIRRIAGQGGTAEASSALVRAAREITKAREVAVKEKKEAPLRAKFDDKTAVVMEVPETVTAAEAETIEEPRLAPEQIAKMEDDLEKLRKMANYLEQLRTMAKTMEKGLKPLTSKKRLEEIMGLGGARGVEDTLYTTQTEILTTERSLAEQHDDVEAMKRTTAELHKLRETREKQLKVRDEETMQQIRDRVA